MPDRIFCLIIEETIDFMPNQKILYVTTEMFPYQEDSNMAAMVNKMSLKMHQEGNDVRVVLVPLRTGRISDFKGGVRDWHIVSEEELDRSEAGYEDGRGRSEITVNGVVN